MQEPAAVQQQLFPFGLQLPPVSQRLPNQDIQPRKHVPKQNCRTVPKENCRDVVKQNCHTVPKENCRDVVKQDRHTVPKESCRDVVKQDCQQASRNNCKRVPRESYSSVPIQKLSDAWPGLQTCLNKDMDCIENMQSSDKNISKNTCRISVVKSEKKIKTIVPQIEQFECEYCNMKFSVNIRCIFLDRSAIIPPLNLDYVKSNTFLILGVILSQ